MSNLSKIKQRFSTYIKIKTQNNASLIPVYQSDVKLAKQISAYLKDNPEANETFWVNHFLKILKDSDYEDELTNKFIFCYLQIPCWYAAKKVSFELKNSSNLNLYYSQEDCFLIACELTLKPIKIVKNFDLNGNVSLSTYAQAILTRMIKNEIVRQVKSKAIKFSNNGLLHNISKKRLNEALNNYGLTKDESIKYNLVWQVFQELFNHFYPINDHNNKSQKYASKADLKLEHFNLIKDRCNQQLQRLKLDYLPFQTQEIQDILDNCAKAVRNYQNNQTSSLENQKEIETVDDNSIDLLVEEEEKQEFSELRKMVLQQLENLASTAKKSLLLWLGLDIKQRDFISFLQLKAQFQVSREFKRYLQNILKSVMKIYLPKNKQITDKELNQLCQQNLKEIKEYLQYYSKEYFSVILIEVIKKDSNSWNKFLSDKQEFKQLLISFTKAVEINLKIDLINFQSAPDKIKKFVNNWLEKNQAFLT